MNYKKEDIQFESISPRAFENLCYDLIIKYGFTDVIWRDGGADNGRDIEGNYYFSNPIANRNPKYYFECKHYTSGGVPPEHLSSKIVWADAEKPAALVIFFTSYPTNNARTWLEKIAPTKNYDIIIIEGEDLKERLLKYPELVERYFSQNRYERLLSDFKEYKIKLNINASYEVLKEILGHMDFDKLDIDDISYLLLEFYMQFHNFQIQAEHYGEFDETIIYKLLDYLKEKVTNEKLASFDMYKDHYTPLGGSGMFDEMDMMEIANDDRDIRRYNFQEYYLHLNHDLEESKWKTGIYLLIIYKNTAFELFKLERPELRIIRGFTPEKILEISLGCQQPWVDAYKAYVEYFGGQLEVAIADNINPDIKV